MHPANVNVLNAPSIDCTVLSNNHVIDWERDGLRETLETLHKARIKTAGAGANIAEASAPAIFDVPDGRVLVFAMAHLSSGVPPEWAALPARSGVHLLTDLSRKTALRIAQEIKTVPHKAGDRVIVSIHWGGNWGYDIPREQETFAKTLIDQGGVDIVHGHSSHHPKRMEIYRGRLILYGAGDLINVGIGRGRVDPSRADADAALSPQSHNSRGNCLAATSYGAAVAWAAIRDDRGWPHPRSAEVIYHHREHRDHRGFSPCSLCSLW